MRSNIETHRNKDEQEIEPARKDDGFQRGDNRRFLLDRPLCHKQLGLTTGTSQFINTCSRTGRQAHDALLERRPLKALPRSLPRPSPARAPFFPTLSVHDVGICCTSLRRDGRIPIAHRALLCRSRARDRSRHRLVFGDVVEESGRVDGGDPRVIAGGRALRRHCFLADWRRHCVLCPVR